MTLRLTESQRNFLRAQPTPAGDSNKIRLALRIVDSNQLRLAEALSMTNQQLSKYVTGGNLTVTTAWRIASVFGVGLDDLFPPPTTTDTRRTGKPTRSRSGRSVRSMTKIKGPKAQAAA